MLLNNEDLLKCIKDTVDHKTKVASLMNKVINDLTLRSINHDNSKLTSIPEFESFMGATVKLRGLTYGSPEYEKIRTVDLAEAIAHHYSGNDHHPEHYQDGKEVYTTCCRKVLSKEDEYFVEKYHRCPYCDVSEEYMKGDLIRERPTLKGMNLISLLEMICDWMAACQRHADGNIFESLKINKQRFSISDDLYRILENTIEYIRSLN